MQMLSLLLACICDWMEGVGGGCYNIIAINKSSTFATYISHVNKIISTKKDYNIWLQLHCVFNIYLTEFSLVRKKLSC